MAAPARAGHLRSRARWALIVMALLLACILALLWYVGVFGGNVRVVVPGKVYRSAQLTGNTLDSVLKLYDVHTVINLRGGSSEDSWYRSERAECARLGVAHLDITFSAVRLPPPQQLQKLLAAFDKATYPVLIHCQGGADRSGMTGAIYLNLYQKVPLAEAVARQLTWRYGHISWGEAHAMDDFFALYGRTSGGLDLREWIERRYPAIYASLPPEQKMAIPAEAPAAPASQRHAVPVTRGRALLQGG